MIEWFQNLPAWSASLALVGLIVILLSYMVIYNRLRKAKLIEITERLGLVKVGIIETQKQIGSLCHLFYPRGIACELMDGEELRRYDIISSAWRARRCDVDFIVFDLSISSRYYNRKLGSVSSSDRESSRRGMSHQTTIQHFDVSNLNLPPFVLRERLPHKKEYIKIDNSEKIGAHYRLCALEKDKAGVAKLFSKEIIEFLKVNRLWSIEVHGARLFIFQKNNYVRAHKFEEFLQNGEKIFKFIQTAANDR